MRVLYKNASLCACSDSVLDVEHGSSFVADGDRIAMVGPSANTVQDIDAEVDCRGLLVTPALIDCHTHLVYADPERKRVQEFEQKIAGASYTEIARRGGGIRSTMQATRAASVDDLYSTAERDVRELQSFGVATVEIKASYATHIDHTVKEFEVIERIRQTMPINIQSTYCPQTIPPEFDGHGDRAEKLFIDHICQDTIPHLYRQCRVEAIDTFCEKEGVGLSLQSVRRILEAGKARGWHTKVHADQFSRTGAASVVAELGGLSADHLEYVDVACIKQMALSGTTAVLLPGAFHYQRESHPPPVADFRALGVPMAIATDSNPGSSPLISPLLAMNFACVHFGLTPTEALLGMTRHAARALGMPHLGTIEVGKQADIAFWEVVIPSELVYHGGRNLCVGLVYKGQRVFDHLGVGLI